MNLNKNDTTASQACSQFTSHLSKAIRDLNNTDKNKEMLNLSVAYSQMLSVYPEDNIEKTIYNMLKTNNDMVGLFNKDKERLKNVIEDLINPNCIGKDFINGISDLYTFLRGGYPSTYKLKEQKVLHKANLNKEIKEIYKTGVLDWEFVKKQFPDRLDFWKVKEANAWLVCFVEKCNYNINDIIVRQDNGFADKQKTFNNLINKVNESSLTQKNPFYKGKNFLFFNAANSGEVDVMLWNSKNRKVIGSSATRDRGYRIEGNQFFRHLLRSYVLKMKIEYCMKINEKNKNERIERSPKTIQDLVRSDKFNKYNYVDDSLKVDKKFLTNNDVNEEIENDNEFAKNLSFYRVQKTKFLGVNYLKNGLNISEGEVSTLDLFNNGVDFVFYGETLENKNKASIRAGLNCLAYRDNFSRIGAFEMKGRSATILLNSIHKRFNGVAIDEVDVELQSQKYIIESMKGGNDINKMTEIMSMFSTGNVQQDERACLFKACSILFKDINREIKKVLFQIENDFEIKRNTLDKTIEKGIKRFFNAGISNDDVKFLKDFFKDKKQIVSFIKNLERIKIPNSEVPMEFEELKNNAENTIYFKRSFNDKEEISELKKELILKNKNEEDLKKKSSIRSRP